MPDHLACLRASACRSARRSAGRSAYLFACVLGWGLAACDDASDSTVFDAGQADAAVSDASPMVDADAPVPLKADGEPCVDGAECENTCYVLPMFGGTCGGCASDADCAGGGCNRPSLTTPTVPPQCHAGELGGTCESDAACEAGLTCISVISNALLDVAGCSRCETSADCPDGSSCNAAIDLAGLSGHQRCVDDGRLEIGDTCSVGAAGDAACATGICAAVDVQGAQVGVCSQCMADADCGDEGSCAVAALDLTVFAVVPGQCR